MRKRRRPLAPREHREAALKCRRRHRLRLQRHSSRRAQNRRQLRRLQHRTPVSSSPGFSTERLRDYVGAFVLAGLDPRIGSETEFFADRVQYYDEGVISREKICKDLERYAARWPERRFWLDGDITVDPQNGNRVRVTFPLRYELRNGAKHSSGKISKTLVLQPAGDDLQIVAVNERKAG